MTDVEQILRERLAEITADVEAMPRLVTDVVRNGRRIRRLRAAVAASSTVAGVTAVVVAAALVSGGSGPPATPMHHPTPSPSPRLDTPPLRTADFSVGAPLISMISGPVPLRRRICRPGDVTSYGELRPGAYGVNGVVILRGHNCSLHLALDAARLAAAGHPGEGVFIHPDATTVNPPLNPRPDLALGRGIVQWGFAWRGSWCGGRRTTLMIPIHSPNDLVLRPNDVIRVPLVGRGPACTGRSSSVATGGVIGQPGAGTLPAPAAWVGLSATLQLPSAIGRRTISEMSVTLHNHTGTRIALSPCARYTLVISSHVVNGVEVDTMAGSIGCDADVTVPARGSRTFTLPSRHYDEGGPGRGADAGTKVTVSFAIAEVPTASASAVAGTLPGR